MPNKAHYLTVTVMLLETAELLDVDAAISIA